MWQTGVVLLIVAGVLIYIVRYYARVYRGEVSACSTCSDDCCASREQAGGAPGGGKTPFPPVPCDCASGPPSPSETGGPTRS
ncbi:MAG: hypothetical protein WAW37_19700 [Syntrophobacteraceae bacterium]